MDQLYLYLYQSLPSVALDMIHRFNELGVTDQNGNRKDLL